MTDRLVRYVIGGFVASAVLALSFLILLTKLSSENTAIQKLQHNFYSTIAANEKLAAVPLEKKSAASNYEDFEQKIRYSKQVNSSTIAVQFFGDIMLDRSVAKVMGERGLDYLFENISTSLSGRIMGAADLLVANLEGPFARVRVPTSKTIAFRFDPALAKQLNEYGFDAVSLANNHTLDMGHANVAHTEEVLTENNIGYFGHQTRELDTLIWVAEEGLPEKVAFIGFNTTDHPLNMDAVKKTLDKAASEARYVFVFMHWGVEYKRISSGAQRTLAHWLIDNGATAVIGAHPHVIQEMEMYKDKPIYYSLGNFVFDQYFSQDTQEGISVGFILQDGEIKEQRVFPFYSKASQVFTMPKDREEKFFEWFKESSRYEVDPISE